MLVKELFARLGLEVDAASFAAGERLMEVARHGWLAVGAAVGAASIAIAAIVKKTADAGYEASKMAQQTGMTTQEFQRLQAAAGPAAEMLTQGLTRLARAANEAGTTGGAAGISFGMLGVSIHGANGRLKPTQQLFLDVAEAVKNQTNETRRAALVQEIFGRGSMALLPFLMKGKEGIKGLMEEADRLGLIMSDKAVADSLAFTHALSDTEDAVKGLSRTIGAELLPIFTSGMERTKEWIVSILPLVKSFTQAVTNTELWKFALMAVSAAIGMHFLPMIGRAAFSLAWFVHDLEWSGIKAMLAAGKHVAASLLMKGAYVAAAVAIAAAINDISVAEQGGESVIGNLWGPRFQAQVRERLVRFWASVVADLKDIFSIDIWKNIFKEFFGWFEERMERINDILPKFLQHAGTKPREEREKDTAGKAASEELFHPSHIGLNEKLREQWVKAGLNIKDLPDLFPGEGEMKREIAGKSLASDLSFEEAQKTMRDLLNQGRANMGLPPLASGEFPEMSGETPDRLRKSREQRSSKSPFDYGLFSEPPTMPSRTPPAPVVPPPVSISVTAPVTIEATAANPEEIKVTLTETIEQALRNAAQRAAEMIGR